jgi:hypothetical protein
VQSAQCTVHSYQYTLWSLYLMYLAWSITQLPIVLCYSQIEMLPWTLCTVHCGLCMVQCTFHCENTTDFLIALVKIMMDVHNTKTIGCTVQGVQCIGQSKKCTLWSLYLMFLPWSITQLPIVLWYSQIEIMPWALFTVQCSPCSAPFHSENTTDLLIAVFKIMMDV